jgi:hypothetical protein
MIISVVANILPCPIHPNAYSYSSSQSQSQPKTQCLCPVSQINSVDIKLYQRSRSLIRSRRRSLSLFVPILLTLSLGATDAAYPLPETTLRGKGTCLALTSLLGSGMFLAYETSLLRSSLGGTMRIVVVVTLDGEAVTYCTGFTVLSVR